MLETIVLVIETEPGMWRIWSPDSLGDRPSGPRRSLVVRGRTLPPLPDEELSFEEVQAWEKRLKESGFEID
ncbi:hypothetical protein [Zavarzinella formosa]|uniref:hypothetical protein n=1 Tax=Zavarzinella formosa TaxID=360055 RepID=UPI0002E55212|nr:hypothetical protein [Zavarzinella formosa]